MVKFNKSELKWLIILIGLTYYIYMLLSTKSIYYFLHPRMIKYIYISLIFLVLLTLIQLRRLFTIIQKRKISFSIFLVPIILGLLVNPHGLSAKIAGKNELSLFPNNIIKSNTSSTIDNKKAILTVDGSNFTTIYDDITYATTNKYIGQKIKITGLVYKDGTTSKNEFCIGRLMMVCCAADTEITGLLCDWGNASSYTTDQWVTVTGTIGKLSHMDSATGTVQVMPFIKVEKVKPAKKPTMPYIYPE